jgi:hypothetical protein
MAKKPRQKGDTKLLSPQQVSFLAYYTNPHSETFGNALRSGLKAGYSQEYSENITSELPDWLSENLGDTRRLVKAEKNLEEVQNIQVVGEDGKADPQLIQQRTKVDMFIAERIGKHKYSARQELTGKDGEALNIQVINYADHNSTLSIPTKGIPTETTPSESEV